MGTRGHLFLPIVVILVVMFSGSSAPLAALAATASCVPLIYLRGKSIAAPMLAGIFVAVAIGLRNRGGFDLTGPAVIWGSVVVVLATWFVAGATAPARSQFKRSSWLLLDGLIDGAKNALSVALACACAGIVIGIIALSGIGQDFTQVVVGLAKDALWLALLATAIAGIILGMGMPTTPAYILMVSLLVPAVHKLGVPLPAAHMFAFYFAILSAITPPVALAVFAAASLAKADVWKTGWAAIRIGAAGFIVPFMFAYEPALLLIGKDWAHIAQACATATIGCIGLAAGLYGYFLRACSVPERVALVAGAFCLIHPGLVTDLIGFGLFVVVAGWQWIDRPRRQAA
jgi:TRAP transporter 4TM/12TM fusion protein